MRCYVCRTCDPDVITGRPPPQGASYRVRAGTSSSARSDERVRSMPKTDMGRVVPGEVCLEAPKGVYQQECLRGMCVRHYYSLSTN